MPTKLISRLKTLTPFGAWLILAGSAFAQTLEVRNAAGLLMKVSADDSNPALVVVVPDGAGAGSESKVLFPEHVTVRAHGQSEQTHLFIFQPGQRGASPKWKKSGNALEYTTDFGQIRFAARATLVEDGIVFRYEFVNRSGTAYDTATAVTDPRFRTIFYDPRLERTYVHHTTGFELLASETPERLSMPLQSWFPVRYHASYTAPVPAERVQHRDDGINYYYKSRTVDVPMVATLSADGRWVAASFARNPGNVWSNAELTCQHVDPEVSLSSNGRAVYEVKILIFSGSLDDALHKVTAQRQKLK